jgi:glutamate synthase (ferredoxin)
LKNNPEITDFYKFHGGLLESWDGPALLVFSDGKSIGASLDRNGLRPARFSIDRGGTVYMMSETGVIPDLKEADIVEKGRLGPGQMVNVDLVTGEFKNNIQIKSEIASRKCLTGLFVRVLTCTRTVSMTNSFHLERPPIWRMD